MTSKILSYIGFARRSGKVKMGVNACATLKGYVPLLILCETASPNTIKDAEKLSKKFHSKIISTSGIKLEDILNKENCKLLAICDNSLAKAILENVEKSDERFVLFGGNKN